MPQIIDSVAVIGVIVGVEHGIDVADAGVEGLISEIR